MPDATTLRGSEQTTSERSWSPGVRDALREYVAHPLFRAATYDELVIADNPFRRPVRPEDLAWLDFGPPVSRSTSSCLSALLGHRMLRNVLDADRPGSLVPSTWTSELRTDAEAFHSRDNRRAGAAVRPFLEDHLFGFTGSATASPLRDPSAALELLLEESARRARRWGALLEPLGQDARRTVVVQLLAPALVARGLDDDVVGLQEQVARTLDLAHQLDLSTTPHSYWQYYLPTSLALANQLDRDPGAPAAWRRGVLTAYVVDARARLDVLAPDTVLPCPQVEDDAAFLRGLRETDVLLDAAAEDLARQLELVGGAESMVALARRLHDGIQRDGVEVDLDTFVESWEECSTTHVHDDDRLVVVESGEMVFWTCLGQEIRLQEGEMTFVPKHRLHGSVVFSGTCTYHQPVITDDLSRRYA